MIKFKLLSCLVIIATSCFAQENAAKISSIKAYVKRIDSLIDIDDKRIHTLISDGKIEIKKVINPNENKKSSIKKRIGGFSESIYYNNKSDTIYKIAYHDNADKNLYETYYYQNNKLIAASVALGEDHGTLVTLLSKNEFYQDDKIISLSEVTNKDLVGYQKRISYSLFDKGTKKLADCLRNIYIFKK